VGRVLDGVTTMLLLAAPEPGSVGSVDGPFAWVDAHVAYEAEQIGPLTTSSLGSIPGFMGMSARRPRRCRCSRAGGLAGHAPG
jgi:hypothetical protein